MLWLIRIYGPIDLPSLIVIAGRKGVRFRDANTYVCEHLRDRVVRFVAHGGKECLDVTPAGRLLCPASDEPVPVVEPIPARRMAEAVKWMWGQR